MRFGCMLRRTSRVNLPALKHYLSVCFPLIPADWREPIVQSAYAAAQQVAATYVELVLRDNDKRVTHAKGAMARWNHGLSALEPNHPDNMDADSRDGFSNLFYS